ncbi:MAG: hypothetical protein IJE93_02360 [Clostridia bacterium]|nr:hypothetical protein [Clostridia bacterium]
MNSQTKNFLDAFLTPNDKYGEVPFYWWGGDKLDRERLSKQLQLLKEKGIAGIQINYSHQYSRYSTEPYGGHGKSIEGEPEQFSEEWWDFFSYAAKECEKLGMGIGVGDYTLAWIGNGFFTDRIANTPGMNAENLCCKKTDFNNMGINEHTLAVVAYEDKDYTKPVILFEKGKGFIDIQNSFDEVFVIESRITPLSISPLNPDCGKMLVRIYFEEFERRNPQLKNGTLNYFFQDELLFNTDHRTLWRSNLREEFIKKFNYDILGFIPHTFFNLSDITPKIRLDLADVKTQLMEDCYFKPIYDFHASRGLIYGCDQSSRGKQPDEFSDYFRTVRWFTAPGNDTPGRAADLIKVKVNSSIAHLYKRPRVWLEGYHSSGWGTTLESITAPTSDNFIFGANLLNLHGLYYSTNGGFYEWAPPDFHFRMPYWDDEQSWLMKYKRLASILTYGTHLCDAAVFYPVSSFDYGENCEKCKNSTFDTAEKLFNHGIDFDFIDFQSIDNAVCENGTLNIADEKYKILIFCDVDCIRYSNIRKIKEFLSCDGKVAFVGCTPFASDLNGANDKLLNADIEKITSHKNCILVKDFYGLYEFINSKIQRSFIPEKADCKGKVYVTRRHSGDNDLFFVRYAEKNSLCRFEATGNVYMLESDNGKIYKLDGTKYLDGYTYIKMPNDANADTLILFTDDTIPYDAALDTSDSNIAKTRKKIELDGKWQFSLVPTLDNTYGDFYLPAGGVIGAQARFFDCTAAENSDCVPEKFTFSSLPYCHAQSIKIIRSKDKTQEICKFIAKTNKTDGICIDNELFSSEILSLHDRYGFIYLGKDDETFLCEQGFHGLKGKVFDDNFYFDENSIFVSDISSDTDCEAFMITDGEKADFLYINGEKTDINTEKVKLHKGKNTVVAGFVYDESRFECMRNRGKVKRATLLFSKNKECKKTDIPLSTCNFANSGYFRFVPHGENEDIYCFRFTSVPGFEGFSISLFGTLTKALSDNEEMLITEIGKGSFGTRKFEAKLKKSSENATQVVLFVKADSGYSYTSIIPEPVDLKTGDNAVIRLGDTSKMGALECYSGKLVYEKSVFVESTDRNRKYILSLGEVGATAKIEINSEVAAILTFAPFEADISRYLINGENKLKITVSNTLCNHYSTIPSRYSNFPADAKSGLIGPVTINII